MRFQKWLKHLPSRSFHQQNHVGGRENDCPGNDLIGAKAAAARAELNHMLGPDFPNQFRFRSNGQSLPHAITPRFAQEMRYPSGGRLDGNQPAMISHFTCDATRLQR
jgi:hypothetical protein